MPGTHELPRSRAARNLLIEFKERIPEPADSAIVRKVTGHGEAAEPHEQKSIFQNNP
jgi:hypothetical protein